MKAKRNSVTTLLRSIPSLTVTFFILSVIFMNIFGSRELYSSEYLCLNTGILFSWIPFICMDCVVKRFGSKAAIKLNMVAIAIEVAVSVIFFLIVKVPGAWAAMFSASDPEAAALINAGIDSTFAGTWYVVFGSIVSMAVSGVSNALLNERVGKSVKDTMGGFAARSLISTVVAQWLDNFVFSAIVSHVLFGWTWTQVVICATTSMLIELALEALLTPLGYKISKRWEDDKVGEEYLKQVGA